MTCACPGLRAPAPGGSGRIAELLVPVGRPPARREVEHREQRLDRPDVARVLPGVARREEELRGPEVAGCGPAAVEDRSHWLLVTITALALAFAAVVGARATIQGPSGSAAAH